MAYLPYANDLSPALYFSFSIVDQNQNPINLIGQESIIFPEEYFYTDEKDHLNRFVALPNQSYGSVEEPASLSSSVSLAFWFAPLEESSTYEIFSWKDQNNFVELEFDQESSVFNINTSSDGQDSFAAPEADLYFFVLNFDDGSFTAFLNAEQVYSLSLPRPESSITFGSLDDLSGIGDSSFGEIIIFDYVLSNQEISILFDLGLLGFQRAVIESGSQIGFSDAFGSALQTAWQAYGNIFTKR
jgi:hypothetical protein